MDVEHPAGHGRHRRRRTRGQSTAFGLALLVTVGAVVAGLV